MSNTMLIRLLEHNHWANLRILQTCEALTDEQLDAEPHSATQGTIRSTLWHMIEAEEDYTSQLHGESAHYADVEMLPLADIRRIAAETGERLMTLACGREDASWSARFEYDGYSIEPWVVMLQLINHSHEHREQIKSMLSALGVTPPRVDGWMFGRVNGALVELTPPGG